MSSIERPSCISDRQHVSIKNSLYHAIKKDDLERVRKMMRLFSIEVGEEISTFGTQWTPLHYAVFFKSARILQFLIQLTYERNKNNTDMFIQIVNMPTKSGHSPLMVGAVYDAVECMQVLFKYGGLFLFKKDCSAMDCSKLATKYESKLAADYIQTMISKNGFNDFVEINVEAFKSTPDLHTLLNQRYEAQMDEFTILQNRDLLLTGEPASCIICLQNTGFLKYSNCCGQPLHHHCFAERIMLCPLCKSNNFYLIAEVLHPNRAFLPVQEDTNLNDEQEKIVLQDEGEVVVPELEGGEINVKNQQELNQVSEEGLPPSE